LASKYWRIAGVSCAPDGIADEEEGVDWDTADGQPKGRAVEYTMLTQMKGGKARAADDADDADQPGPQMTQMTRIKPGPPMTQMTQITQIVEMGV
jgi:hypothetical protein